jgi:protease-4
LSTVLIVLLLAGLGGSLLVNLVLSVVVVASGGADRRVHERHFSHAKAAPNKVAIISVEGVILDGEGLLKRQIDQAREDKSVKAVVLRVNSPGGTITGSDLIYHRLAKLGSERGIPLVVSMGGIAASGGYYASMAVGSRPETIFAEPTTWTGSIGVIIPHYNAEDLMEKVGVQQDSVLSRPLKGMGTFTRKMTDEERKIFQGLVDAGFARFKDVIKQGRPKFMADPAALEKLSTGQVYTAAEALDNGLIDKVGYLEDAVEQAIKLAGLSPEQVEVVEYRPEFSLAQLLLGAQSRPGALDPAALLEMTVPRAYYLCTWLPPAFSVGE